ncbi:MAG TPA: DUF2339 domain-containing protein [Gallionellaceae bacterium]
MWLGLIAGGLLGLVGGGPAGGVIGAVVGIIASLFYGESQRTQAQLEQRITALEKTVRDLGRQLAASSSETTHAAAAPRQPVEAAPAASPVREQPARIYRHATVTLDDLQSPPEPVLAVASPATTFQPAPAEPVLPDWLTNLFRGNILAKIGVIILFFGVASGLKLAVDMGLFPVSVRLMLGAVAAIGMSIFGYVRGQDPEHRKFGQALQGGGLAILYLLVFFMLARYQLLGPTPSFILFTLIGVSCILLAARQDARALAVLGISGAFLSPVLAASSGGSQTMLFSYFLLLNSFIIAVNWFKGWRALNLIGFVFTLVIGMGWAFRSYQPSDFPVSETFLVLFFLLYSATPVLFNLFNAPGRLGWGDGMLLYGTPLAAAALQNHLLAGQDMTLAWNACAAGAYYLLLWWAIYRHPNEETVWLEKSLLAVAIGFFTLAIPLAFNAQLTAAFWTLEGFGVLYLGVQQDRFLARLFGSAMQYLAGIYFWLHIGELGHALPVVNDVYIGCVIVVIAALASALLLQRSGNDESRHYAPVFLYWGLAWWFVSGWEEIERFAAPALQWPDWLALCTASFVFLDWLGARRAWHAMRQTTLLLLAVALLAALQRHIEHGHALYGTMALMLPLALAAHYWLLYRHDRDNVPALSMERHALTYWLLLALAGSELAWVSQQLAPSVSLWPLLAWGLTGAVGILISLRGVRLGSWPFAQHAGAYTATLQYPVVLALCAWLLLSNFSHSGGGSGLPYLPVLNVFDLTQLLVLFALWRWARSAANEVALPAVYAGAFLWISTEAARITHHWGGVPFDAAAMFHSAMLQASLSLLWTTMAMGLMIFASQRALRTLWFGGFGLLALVGVKLMMVDLANKGTVMWTLSLIGIALLVIAASYFSPAPPKVESGS